MALIEHSIQSCLAVADIALTGLESQFASLLAGGGAAAAAASASSTSASTSAAAALVTTTYAPILAVVAFGFLLRLATVLTLSLYSDRSLDLIANASPELQKAFMLYAEVAWNPHALRTEIELAGKRHRERASKIMKKHSTGRLRYWVPVTVAGYISAVGGACMWWVAPPLSASPLIASYSGIALLNGVNLAAVGLGLYNRKRLIDFRLGFNDKKDEALQRGWGYFQVMFAAWLVLYAAASLMFLSPVEAASTSAPTTAAATDSGPQKDDEVESPSSQQSEQQHQLYTFVAPDGAACIPFFLLGLFLAGALQHPLRDLVIKRNRFLAKKVFRWPQKRPPLHGTYGDYHWTVGEHVKNMHDASATTGEMQRMSENYMKGKIQLEYECDRRLSKMPWLSTLFVDSRIDGSGKYAQLEEPPGEVAYTKDGRMPLNEYRDKYGSEGTVK